MSLRTFAVIITGLGLSGCGFLPGFGVLEDAPLYYLPVGTIANQVACEVQEFVADQNKKKADGFHLGRWRISNDPVSIKLSLTTDNSGYVNFTGVNVASLGLSSLAAFITTQSKVPTLAAKLSAKRTRTVTVAFTVSPNPFPSSLGSARDPATGAVVGLRDPVTGALITLNCAKNFRKDDPLTRLFLRDWLTNYFETINTLDRDQSFPPSDKITDNLARAMRHVAQPDAIPEQFDIQSVDLTTQIYLAADVSGGATPNVLGNGSVFILPISGLSFDYNPDYTHKIDLTINMCDSLPIDSVCNDNRPKAPTGYEPILDRQCKIYADLAPLLKVNPPREYEGGGKYCSGRCKCNKDTGTYSQKVSS
jgi:hypothetical protein